MATIGNTENVGPVAEDLAELGEMCLALGSRFAMIAADKLRYGLDEDQVNAAVSALDIAAVQTKFNAAKAKFQSATPV